MAVLNDLMVKGKTRLIGDVNAGNIKSSTLNTGIISASTVSSTSSTSTSYTENGVLLSNKYAAKSHTHTLSQVYSDAVAQGSTVATNDTLLICPRNTSTGVIKQPDALKFDTTDATKYLCHNGTWATITAGATDACTVSSTITSTSTTGGRTVTAGRPLVNGFVIGTNGGIGLLTSVSLTQGATYNMSWNYCGTLPLPSVESPLLLSNSNTTFTGKYYRVGKMVTVTGYFSGTSSSISWSDFLPYAANNDYVFTADFWNSSNVKVTGIIKLTSGQRTMYPIGYAYGSSTNGTYVSNSTGAWLSVISGSVYVNFTYLTDAS